MSQKGVVNREMNLQLGIWSSDCRTTGDKKKTTTKNYNCAEKKAESHFTWDLNLKFTDVNRYHFKHQKEVFVEQMLLALNCSRNKADPLSGNLGTDLLASNIKQVSTNIHIDMCIYMELYVCMHGSVRYITFIHLVL